MLSMLILVMGLAPILGPLVGGQLLVNFGWRSVFWVLTAYGATWCVVAALFLPESLAPESRRQQPLRAILAIYGRLLRDRTYLGYVFTGRFHLRRPAGLYFRVAVRPDRDLRRPAGTIRHLLRHQRGRDHWRIAGQSLAGGPDGPEAHRPHRPAHRDGRRFRRAVQRLHRIWRAGGDSRPAVLLHRLPRLRHAECHGAGDGAARARLPAARRRCSARSSSCLARRQERSSASLATARRCHLRPSSPAAVSAPSRCIARYREHAIGNLSVSRPRKRGRESFFRYDVEKRLPTPFPSPFSSAAKLQSQGTCPGPGGAGRSSFSPLSRSWWGFSS